MRDLLFFKEKVKACLGACAVVSPLLQPVGYAGFIAPITTLAPVVIASPAVASLDESSGECSADADYGDVVLDFEGGDTRYFNPGSTATGNYQFTFENFINQGYVSSTALPSFGEGEWDNVVWTGKDGVWSRMDFVNSMTAQNNMLATYTEANLASLADTWSEGDTVDGIPLSSGGVGLASHMLGAPAFRKWADSGFTASGLSSEIAAAHGWTQQEYQEHLVRRLAAGGCYDPSMIDTDGVGDSFEIPKIYLIQTQVGNAISVYMPGQF